MRYGEILGESSRADFYHATGIAGAMGVLQAGGIRSGWAGTAMDKFAAISLTRDPRLRFYKDPAGEFAGKAPVQFVVDGEALGRQTRMRPWCNPWEEDSDCETRYSAVDRYEAEERVMARFIPLRFIKAMWIESDVISGNCDDPDEPFVTTGVDRRGRWHCAIRPQAMKDLIALANEKGVPVRDLRTNPRDASMARLGR